ncbi:MAG: hypothetical protein J6J22_07550 [Alistipes sp.]|nr:hypothetical protein [Alistipes sp.]
MKLIVVILSLLMVGCYNKVSAPEPAPEVITTNATIAQLKRICSSGVITFTPNLPVVITGTVISSDKESYINGAIYIDDGTATAKLLVGIYDSFSIYPEGSQISISMTGLTAGIEDHQLSIGLVYENSKTLYAIKSSVILDKHITCKNSINKIEPQVCSISDIDTDLCGKLITINSLNYVYTCYEENYRGKYFRFCDTEENFIYVYIDQYAAGFKNVPPQEPSDITGIVTYQKVPFDTKECFVILPRGSKDIWN